jgi:cysteine-rich repeat protein
MAPYLIGEPPSGPGIRHYSYSTDLGIDPLTYADIASLDPPHGVGEVWAAALWEMYWNLVGVYGFDPDLALGAGGNEIALGLVVDALALQPCEPTFLDARDAILSADSLADAGANRCLIWAAFAKRGMGASAADGGASTSVAVTEAFDVPAECTPACGDALLQAGEQCDDGNTQGFDGCAATCRTETPLRISGSAQGISVSVTVDGRLITVATSPGQSGSSVAAALAAAIAADPVLSAAGETAAVQGNQIAVTGTVTGFTLGDAGLLPIPVPSLSPRGALLAAAVLALAALHLLRRRGAAEAA